MASSNENSDYILRDNLEATVDYGADPVNADSVDEYAVDDGATIVCTAIGQDIAVAALDNGDLEIAAAAVTDGEVDVYNAGSSDDGGAADKAAAVTDGAVGAFSADSSDDGAVADDAGTNEAAAVTDGAVVAFSADSSDDDIVADDVGTNKSDVVNAAGLNPVDDGLVAADPDIAAAAINEGAVNANADTNIAPVDGKAAADDANAGAANTDQNQIIQVGPELAGTMIKLQVTVKVEANNPQSNEVTVNAKIREKVSVVKKNPPEEGESQRAEQGQQRVEVDEQNENQICIRSSQTVKIRSRTQQETHGNNNQYQCRLCNCKIRNAIITICGHLYCWPCLWAFERSRLDNTICPHCKSPLKLHEDVVPYYGGIEDDDAGSDVSVIRPSAFRINSRDGGIGRTWFRTEPDQVPEDNQIEILEGFNFRDWRFVNMAYVLLIIMHFYLVFLIMMALSSL